MKKYQLSDYLLAMCGLLLLAWPLYFDQAKLNCEFAPADCNSAAMPLLCATIASMAIGGFMVSYALFAQMPTLKRRIIAALVLMVPIGLLDFVLFFFVTFSRDFKF